MELSRVFVIIKAEGKRKEKKTKEISFSF